MTYQETVDFLYSQLPMYSRIGKEAFKKDLTNTLALCELLGNPQKKFKSIHIAGTNGKGSTSHMLAAILQQSGYKTGLYTSPHLKDFRERIRLNGQMISEQEVTEFVWKYKNEVLKIGCSFFEWSVGLAYDFFAKQKVDVAVIETGLGGRLDSTNVIMPVLSVITNISYDHMDMLGDTLEKIAWEKGGIIKQNVPVVIGETTDDTKNIFIQKAAEMNAPIFFADQELKAEEVKRNFDSVMYKIQPARNRAASEITLDLVGEYQSKNIVTVLKSVAILNTIGFHISAENSSSALQQVKKLTGLRGRWDVLQHSPLVIADVAHNEAGLKFSFHHLKEYPYQTLRLVIGFVKEKDLDSILTLFPKNGVYYFCKPNIPRGMDEIILLEKAKSTGLTGTAFSSVSDAYHTALKEASEKDLIYVGGSTFVVAEILNS
jgi:dihydrofolate synthase / folylpolyglutamate synthase